MKRLFVAIALAFVAAAAPGADFYPTSDDFDSLGNYPFRWKRLVLGTGGVVFTQGVAGTHNVINYVFGSGVEFYDASNGTAWKIDTTGLWSSHDRSYALPDFSGNFAILANGRLTMTTGSAPTVSSATSDCGSSPTISGRDGVGRVTVGSGTNGGKCTVNFNVAWTAAPICLAQNETSGAALTAKLTTTGKTELTGALNPGDSLVYVCSSFQ